MLEQICRSSLRNMCAEIIYQHNPPLFKLKGDTSEQTENPYKNFLSDGFDWFNKYISWGRGSRKRTNDWSVAFFHKQSKSICNSFLLEKYAGNIEYAMDKSQGFDVLYHQFLDWFDRKRRNFRMNFDIAESKKQILENGKRSNSHGGVANLLKVLTKTMEKQGASIENIAKVQYTICIQAGIYIPDEFIEDVAVALYIENGEKRNEK